MTATSPSALFPASFERVRPWRKTPRGAGLRPTGWATFRLLVLAVWFGALRPSAATAVDFAPDDPPLCQATIGSSGGQNASWDIFTNSAFARADGGAGTEHSSDAEIGLVFVPAASFLATVEMGVSYSGLLVGSLGTNTIYGDVRITVELEDFTAAIDHGTEVIFDKRQDGAFAETIFDVVASNPFNPPVATFANVQLLGGHQYVIRLKVVAKAKGLAGRADFKGTRYVRFGCVSITPELVDSDGDGLYDDWEDNGIDLDGDNVPDLDLPGMGAESDHKDLFIEMDWRTGQQPSRAEIQAMKAVFAAAPKDAGGVVNPDNQDGITLWVDTGDLMDGGMLVGDDFGGGNEITDPVICLDDSFYEAKDEHFDWDMRRLVFRYVISSISPGENACDDGSKPAGIGEVGGNDFVVFSTDPGLVVHELGHTLNLRHGGFENRNNKPNYISMMNYNYGASLPQASGGGLIDFSPPLCPACPGGRSAIPGPLDETALDETLVMDPNDDENMFQYRDLQAITRGGPLSGNDTDGDATPDIDWDGDGTISNVLVTVDINEDGKCVEPGDNGTMETMPDAADALLSDGIIHDWLDRVCDTAKGAMTDDVQKRAVGTGQSKDMVSYDDWSNIVLNFREFGDSADGPLNLPEGERSLADARAQASEVNTTDLEIEKSDLPDPVNANAQLVYTLDVTNHGPQPARGIRVIDSLPSEATYVSDTGGCVEAPAGTLTCELPPLAIGESQSFDVTVVYEADAVADLPAPATVENTATVENRVPYGLDGNLGEVGGDPDESNNSDSEETVINRPPVSDPNGPYVEECQGVTTDVALDGSGSFDPDGDPITYEWTTDCSGGSFDDASAESPILTLTSPPPCPVMCGVTLKVTDPGNLSDTEGTSVTVEDTTPPTITVELTPHELWPPNHKMVAITATVVAEDICDPAPDVVLTSLVSDEPDNAKGNQQGKGDGNTVNDIQDAVPGTADFEFSLRSERAGSEDGRTYTATYTATDECGNSTDGEATVFVPHHP